jgi:hypothetical protein
MMLLFGVTPKEALHAFAAHKDTIHRHDVSGLSIEKVHHHCQFLGFILDAFSDDIAIPYLTLSTNEFVRASNAAEVTTVQRQIVATSLRGPPVA